jgi:glycosyltransferase involved in cell wall biosynthesis
MGFLRPMLERYLDRFYGDCDLILAPTLPIAKELAAKHGAGRVSVWSRGIDPAAFHPSLRDEATRAAFGYAPADVVPLFFGRLVQEKGLGVFAETIDALRASGRIARPLIVGEGPARGWLEKRLPGAVFAGHLEGAALGRAVASADILINPSVTEAFGNVNLEAMASGLAVISADVPSASALISDGRTGWLVPPHAPAAYARAARMLMQEPSLRRAIGTAASNEATRYRWDDVLAGVAADYRRCRSPGGAKVDASPRVLQELAA